MRFLICETVGMYHVCPLIAIPPGGGGVVSGGVIIKKCLLRARATKIFTRVCIFSVKIGRRERERERKRDSLLIV